jgi:starvation-inducible DNA-binding protein
MKFLQIERKELPGMIDEMNTLLANFQVYYHKLRNFHWNVRGENFFELHGQFEKLYQNANAVIDDVAERIQTLKYRPLSTMKKYLETAEVKEVDAFLTDRKMVQWILNDHATIIENLNRTLIKAEQANDHGTIHLLRTIQLELEKQSWMLDTWLSKPVSVNVEEPALAQ